MQRTFSYERAVRISRHARPVTSENTIHGSYVAPNEHVCYFLLESDSFDGVTELLGPPFRQDHGADIVPETTVGDP
jgi:hypothetical protein